MATTTLLLLLKFIHIWAVAMFVGNSVLGPYRRRRARLTGDARIIAGTYAIHTASGPAVTIPWFAAGVLSGLALAWLSGLSLLRDGWVAWSLALTLVVALMFLFCIGPLQRQATAAALLLSESPSPEHADSFERLARELEPFSHAAHVLFAAIIALMVFKPALPVPW